MEGAGEILVLGTDADTEVRLPAALEMGADEALVFDDDVLARIDENPPDVWFESSGAAPAIEAAVDGVVAGGRVICNAIGDGPWDVNMRRVAYDSIQIRGRWGGDSDTIPAAVEAIQNDQLHVSEIITHTLPLTEWERAFELLEDKQGIKILLDPSP
jgi:threonine dehydrogenase-like Zn-dependent dehydrogenase